MLEEVFEHHVEFVWRYALGLGVARSEIDDVVQEVFMVVRRRLPDYDPERSPGSIRAWLGGITRKIVLHHRRSHARHARRLEVVPDPVPERGPDDLLELREAADLMREFLERLDPKKREAFVLAEIEGLTAPEIAAAVGSNPATVYSRIRAAREAFTQYVARLRVAEGRRRA